MAISTSVLNGIHASNIFVPGTGKRPPESMTERMNAIEANKLDTAGAFMGGYKNKIINGSFDIWQRGTSQTTSGYGSADRWPIIISGSSATVSRQSFTPGQTDVPNNPMYFYRCVVSSVTGATNRVMLYQRIENVRTLSGTTATLSFWAKADANRQISTEFWQNFGSGGSPSAIINSISPQKYSITTSWQKITVTVTIPSISGKTIGTDENSDISLAIWFDAGTDYNTRSLSLGHQSGTFDIAQVQLEEGSVATPFESRHIAQELALCQRYYRQTYYLNYVVTHAYNSGNAGGNVANWGISMRRVPTITTFDQAWTINKVSYAAGGGSMSNGVTPPTFFIGLNGFSVCAGGMPVDSNGLMALYFTADAEL